MVCLKFTKIIQSLYFHNNQIDALEGQNAIKHNSTDDLSVQELIDCASAEYHNAGCQGGFMDRGFLYVQDHGISKLVDYPYVAKDEECKSRNNTAKIKLTGFVDLPQEDEESMKQAVGKSIIYYYYSCNLMLKYRKNLENQFVDNFM